MRSNESLEPRAIGLALSILGVAAAISLTVLANPPSAPVLLPILAVIGAEVIFIQVIRRRNGAFPIFEIGVVYSAVVAIYAVYPLVGFMVNGLSYTPYNDDRLVQAKPSAQDIGQIGWYYVVHLAAFIIVYLMVRGRLPRSMPRIAQPAKKTLVVATSMYLIITLYFLLLDRAYGISAGSYMETYRALNQLPFGIAQITSLLDGARFPILLIILVTLFCSYHRYRFVIWGGLALLAFGSLIRVGSRTELVLLLLAAAALYHTLIKPIPVRHAAVFGLAGLAFFIGLGLLRSGWLFSGAAPGFGPFSYANEFEVLFGNAFDLTRRMATGSVGDLPGGFYLSGFVAIVPRILLPFEKMSSADWYVNTFFPVYASQGGGLAFGIISESVLSGIWVDLMLRGAILGLLLAVIHRVAVLHKPSFWMFVFYVWLSTQIYQSFRNTTFIPVFMFFYRFLWVMLLVAFLSMRFRFRIRQPSIR